MCFHVLHTGLVAALLGRTHTGNAELVPAQGPAVISSAEEGTAGTIRLPGGAFPSPSSQAARVVVTVLNIQQLAMFQVRAPISATGMWETLVGSAQPAPLRAGGQPDGKGPGRHRGGHRGGGWGRLGAAGPRAAHLCLPAVATCKACPPLPMPPGEVQVHTTSLFAECHPAVCFLGAQQRYEAQQGLVGLWAGCLPCSWLPPCHQQALQPPSLCSVRQDAGLGWRPPLWPCAGCRAGRRLEQPRMCHTAQGQGDSLHL